MVDNLNLPDGHGTRKYWLLKRSSFEMKQVPKNWKPVKSCISVCLCVWMLTRIAQIITAACTRFLILYAQTYWWTLITNQKLETGSCFSRSVVCSRRWARAFPVKSIPYRWPRPLRRLKIQRKATSL